MSRSVPAGQSSHLGAEEEMVLTNPAPSDISYRNKRALLFCSVRASFSSDSFPHFFSEICKIRVSERWGEEERAKLVWKGMPDRNPQVGEKN